jgi:thioredoxin 2
MNSAATHVACPHCGATNRVPAARLGDDPVCGRCGQALLDGQPVELSDANFDRVVEHSDLPVVVDFWAPWCGPCRQMAPQFEQAAGTLKGRALLVKVNSDDNPRTASRFGIRSIPTLVKLQRGQEVARVAGARPAGQIVQFANG